MSDMTTLLNDLSYIPPYNEHNEPTQGDIGKTSNEPTQDTRNEFEELYASENEELYPGCDYVTRLDFMTKFTYFKVKGKLTNSIFNEMLEFFQNVFPISKGYKLPPSYYAIKKTFKNDWVRVRVEHACEHDCCLFRGDDNKDLDFCPVCNTSRWKDSNTPGKKVSKKVLRYFPIIPRLQRLYKSSHTPKEMIWHATRKCTEPGKMQHLVDGRAWKKFDTKYPNFAKEPRNVRLGLDADGFNPFGNLSQAYNMLLVILTTYNLPPWLRMKVSSFILTLLILGPKSPGKDIDVYLEPLIEDLKVLWDRKGVETIDVASGQKFNMRAMVLWTINDFPAQNNTTKARQDLERLGIRSGLWLGQTKNGKCLKHQAAYSFTPENWKKVLSQYLPDKITKPIIELRSLFKQICSATLMKDDLLKAHIKVVDIMCDLELIYPPSLFDIMIHLVIHLLLEALEGGPIRPWWMFPFERYMKKLKVYFLTKHERRIPRLVWVADNDKDPEVSTTSELFSLACGPTWTLISINSCVVDGVRYVVHSRDERRTTQNSGICSPGPDGEMYYGQLQEILEFKYLLFKVVLFRVKWFDTQNQGRKVKRLVLGNNMTQEGIIVVEDDPDIIHFDNSSDLPLFTSLNDLDNATLHIDGQSTKVDAPPDIIDVVDEDDDIIDDEDAIPHDLVDSDNEDLINVDDDGVDKMSRDVARSYGDDGGGEDRPPPHYVPSGCGGCFANRGKGKRKPSLGGRAACRLNTRDKTRNLSLKEITDTKGPVSIRFELRDKQNLMPLGEHAAHWSSYIGETQFDLRPHMVSLDWTEIHADIQQHLQKAYNTNKVAFKAQHWVIDPTTRTYNVEKIRRARPQDITDDEWDKYIQFWNDPRNIAQAAQNRQNRAKSTRQSSTTQEYPSLIDTFFVAYTVNGEFLRNEDRRIYEEMRRLEATGTYTDDEINRLARGDMFSQFESGGASGSGGCGDDEEGADDQDDEDEDGDGDTYTIPGNMSPGNICHRGPNYLTEKYVGLTVSLGIVVGEGFSVEIPQRQVAGEIFLSNKSSGKALKCRWGMWLML
nr:hypothetical protein [Tanacetum cinerariifolium]